MTHDSSTLKFSLADLCDAFSYGIQLGRSSNGHTSCSMLATKNDVEEGTAIIMSAISDFAVKQTAFNQRQGAAVDAAVASVAGLVEDVKTLNDKIAELQNSVGGVTPEDQALINDLETQGDAMATKTEALSAALATLDAQTPPRPPVA